MLHVQHDYFSLFNKWNFCFVALLVVVAYCSYTKSVCSGTIGQDGGAREI